jgi:hypothetical protein
VRFDKALPPWTHQVVGFSMGVIACSWMSGATSEQVALIRLPSTVVLTVYLVAMAIFYMRALMKEMRN